MAKTPQKAGAETSLDGGVKARVLVDCDLGKCNDVVTISGALAEAMADLIDTDPAAVEYAESTAKE